LSLGIIGWGWQDRDLGGFAINLLGSWRKKARGCGLWRVSAHLCEPALFDRFTRQVPQGVRTGNLEQGRTLRLVAR